MGDLRASSRRPWVIRPATGLLLLVALVPSRAWAQPFVYLVTHVVLAESPSVSLVVINAATGHATATLPVTTPVTGVSPHVVASADGRLVFVAAGDLFVVDPVAGTAVATGLGTHLGPLAISADGSLLFAADQSTSRLLTIATSTRQLVGAPVTLPATPTGVVVSPNGATAWVLGPQTGAAVYRVEPALRAALLG